MYLIIGFSVAFVFLFLAAKYEDKAKAVFIREDHLSGEEQFVEAQRAYLRALRGSMGSANYSKLYARHLNYLRYRDLKHIWITLMLLAIIFGGIIQYFLVWRLHHWFK